MVAYSFNPRFEMPIVTLRKTGTIRAAGKRRHARPGEALQLYTGMRTQACRLLATTTCSSQDRLRAWFDRPRIIIGELEDGHPVEEVNHVADFDVFAQADGFTDYDDMARFWWDVHKTREFDMRWIRWDPTSLRTPLQAAA